jgi:hypothetical protein
MLNLIVDLRISAVGKIFLAAVFEFVFLVFFGFFFLSVFAFVPSFFAFSFFKMRTRYAFYLSP